MTEIMTVDVTYNYFIITQTKQTLKVLHAVTKLKLTLQWTPLVQLAHKDST